MLFDIHTHISQFNHDELDLMIERWQANNVGFVISAGTNPNDSFESIELSKKFNCTHFIETGTYLGDNIILLKVII